MLNIKKVAVRIILGCILAAIIVGQHKEIQRITQERDTYQSNTESLMTQMEVLKKDSTEQVYKIQTLTLKKKEYEAYRTKDAQKIKDLKIKLKRVSSASKQVLEVKVPIQAPIIHKSDSMKLIKLENQHISFVGVLKNDSLDADIRLQVELQQWIIKIPKYKFLWWKWGCKGFSQIIHTNNPYVDLKYSEYIYID